jgi:ketosteroid isomerase-like protein
MGTPITSDFLYRFAHAWNRHDAEAIVSMMTSDAVMFMSGGPTSEGRRVSGREALPSDISAFFKSMPDAQWSDARHFIVDDRCVAQWTFAERHGR